MKIAPTLNSTTYQFTGNGFSSFILMLANIYKNLAQAFNGQIGFGDGTNADNINGSWINVTTPPTPNTDFVVNHNLNRIPVGYLVMQKNQACDVFTGSAASTKSHITLQGSVGNTVLKLFIICLLLGVFCIKSKAQGYAVQGQAQQNISVSGSTGISGGVLQVISGATISVCPGSVAPGSGSICSPVSSSLYSNIGLTTVTANPTNADSNGNYVFFVTPGQSYIVSISGVGVVTYSYIITAPLVTPVSASGANTALSNLTSTNINQDLSFQSGHAVGTTSGPAQQIMFYGTSTYGAGTFFDLIGNPTGARVVTFPDTSDTVMELSFAQTFTSKTFNLNSNTFKNVTNTVGHYPRNNGTQYVDSGIQATDLPGTTSNCSGTSFAQGLNSGGTPICTSAFGITIVYGTPSASGTSSIGTTTMVTSGGSGNTYRFTPYMDVTSAGASCTSGSSVAINITFTDPNGSSQTSIAVVGFNVTVTPGTSLLSNSFNGTVGTSWPPGGIVPVTIRAKASTTVQYSTTYTAGSGCSPSPSYQIYPVLEQLQ